VEKLQTAVEPNKNLNKPESGSMFLTALSIYLQYCLEFLTLNSSKKRLEMSLTET